MERTWAWTLGLEGPLDHLAIPSAVLTRRRRQEYEDETYPAYPNLHDMLFCVVDYSVMCWPEPEDIERAYAMAGCHHLFRSHVEAELICRRQANPS